ncbi:MAG: DUF2203 domain-containing protein [Bryobacteraceae bacterium]|nr:DUF2203 domain-containing protein [Bryobacteraceae bacterium]
MSKYFTIWEAEDLLEQLSEPLRQAITERAELSALESRIQEEARKVFLSGGAVVNQAEAVRLRLRRDTLARRLQETVHLIQKHGCLIKDLDIGLLDFPTLYQGREVYLCWKLGEESIQYWHEVEDGFRGRRPVDADFLAHHSGSARAS